MLVFDPIDEVREMVLHVAQGFGRHGHNCSLMDAEEQQSRAACRPAERTLDGCGPCIQKLRPWPSPADGRPERPPARPAGGACSVTHPPHIRD
jgi:hypothetical protein